MKLIVGLGNPGKEYDKTRHNVGFMAIDYILGPNCIFKNKFNGDYYIDNKQNLIFLKPLCFMNNSGEVVQKFCHYFKIDTDDVLIIYDDMDFDVGCYKVKPKGSSAGHNGMNSIINYLHTNNIKRIRIGIGRSKFNKIDYVLGKFSSDDLIKLNLVFDNVKNIVDIINTHSFDKIMSTFNGKENE